MKHFMCEENVLGALNQLCREQYGAVWKVTGSTLARLFFVCMKLLNIVVLVVRFLKHALVTNDISEASLCFLVNQPYIMQGFFPSGPELSSWSGNLQAVQTGWQCKWLLLMTDSPLAWVLIKNELLPLLFLWNGSGQNWGNGAYFRGWHCCRISLWLRSLTLSRERAEIFRNY